jgi:hypothetical protein
MNAKQVEQMFAAMDHSATGNPDQGSITLVTCNHPSHRLYAGVARDDTKPGGKVFWVGCLDCGAILTPTDEHTA